MNKPLLVNWVVPDNLDTTMFDFSWKPPKGELPFIHQFGTQWQRSGGPKYVTQEAIHIKYETTQSAVILADMTCWVVPANVDTSVFDFSWHPDPTDPPFVYKFPTKWHSVGGPEYIVPGATQEKYIDAQQATTVPNMIEWEVPIDVDYSEFDFGWVPHPLDPPFIYQFGTQWQRTGGPRYVVPGATVIKYQDLAVKKLPIMDCWHVPDHIDTDQFDFSWHPDATEQPYIYQFGTQWQRTGGPRYVVLGATDIKYQPGQKATSLPDMTCWQVPDNNDTAEFDFSWHPDATDHPFIHQFGTQWNRTGGPKYVVPGATEIKYETIQQAYRLPDMTCWQVPDNNDTAGFDFSWHPDATDHPFIHQFGTQWNRTGGPKYVVPGATEIKYQDNQQVRRLPDMTCWQVPANIDKTQFDFSWHPDATDHPFIHQFGTQWNRTGGPKYVVPGATNIKYNESQQVTSLPDMTCWQVPDNNDTAGFDFSWHPDTDELPFIHQFGTQWQRTDGPKYVVPGATEIKYQTGQQAVKMADMTCWQVPANIDKTQFDFSWHPDATDHPFIHQFGNQWLPIGGPRYVCSDATEIKYQTGQQAVKMADMTYWQVPDNIDPTGFDFSWQPALGELPFIHQFGTQWQRTGGPKYVVPGATEIKYETSQKASRLQDMTCWDIPDNVDLTQFDFSWHPDSDEPPFIHQFGNQWDRSGGPRYGCSDATEIKYQTGQQAVKMADMTYWQVPDNIDPTGFDFSWQPVPGELPFIHQFGTQWQRTGGPKYVVPGGTAVKYDTSQQVTKLAEMSSWYVPDNVDLTQFDFSWHPDATDHPFIHQFGNQWDIISGPRYLVPGATEIKYQTGQQAVKMADMTYWVVPPHIDLTGFDFSWQPALGELPFIHQFGTQWQRTGGPKYVVPGGTAVKYDTSQQVTKLAEMSSWIIPISVDTTGFDFSWHPDDTEKPYIYQFGTQWQRTGGPRYFVASATEIKFEMSQRVTALPVIAQWSVPAKINTDDFDFSWHPDDTELPFIHQFGTQWQRTGGPKYVVPGATIVKYQPGQRAIKLIDMEQWTVLSKIDTDEFDFSWHPDDTEKPYIYQFGTKWDKSEGPIYTSAGSNEVKYEIVQIAVRCVDWSRWFVPDDIDSSKFDFSWEPDPTARPYIYQFGTQWNRTGGPRYFVDGASEVKYEDSYRVTKLPNMSRWTVPSKIDTDEFDFSWHPDDTEKPYIYQFGTQWQRTGGPKYNVPSANEIKYETCQHVKKLPAMKFWKIPNDVDVTGFDFSWHPDDTEKPYIYQFGTQWQRTGGPKYSVHGSTEVKYETSQRVTKLPTMEHWIVQKDINSVDFDFSWHPDDTDSPCNYVFGNQYRSAEECHSVMYCKEKTTVNKFMDNLVAKITYVPLDIMFVSNGETGEQRRYDRVCQLAGRKVHWVHGINGREVAFKHAASISSTDWFIVFPGKLYADENFDFNYQPDRYIEPKHYIFYASNPVNGLEYGHQAAVCYHRQHVLETEEHGLDFTLSKPHDIVPVISGVAEFNSDVLMTWRTAFRETLKLIGSTDDESKERLHIWLSEAKGDNAEWSLQGAKDAADYYAEVDGDPTALRLSYDWSWLVQRFDSRR